MGDKVLITKHLILNCNMPYKYYKEYIGVVVEIDDFCPILYPYKVRLRSGDHTWCEAVPFSLLLAELW